MIDDRLKHAKMTLLGELPATETSWVIAVFGDQVILANEKYEPVVIRDGKIEVPTTEVK